MPSEVGHLVDSGLTYPVVRLTGVLDAETAADVRSTLVGLLADGPEALILDVSGLTLEPTGEAVLRAVAQENEDWPAARLVLCGPDPAVWRPIGLPVWPSPAEAIAALGAPETSGRLREVLQPVAGAARRARELVTEASRRWELPEVAESACIVVTELVNNVVAHARTPMTLLLARHAGTMSVAVRDKSSARPRFTGPVAPTSYGGRGLLLIDSVAQRWGNLGLTDGKVVWALLGESPVAGMTGATRG